MHRCCKAYCRLPLGVLCGKTDARALLESVSTSSSGSSSHQSTVIKNKKKTKKNIEKDKQDRCWNKARKGVKIPLGLRASFGGAALSGLGVQSQWRASQPRNNVCANNVGSSSRCADSRRLSQIGAKTFDTLAPSRGGGVRTPLSSSTVHLIISKFKMSCSRIFFFFFS